MSIFKEMHSKHHFDSIREFEEVERMLSEAISRGYVEEVPVMITRPVPGVENWYRDKETGEIYSLSPPNPPSRGSWNPVEVEDLNKSEHGVQ